MLAKKMLAIHKPELINDSMVYELWQDGEVTLTKGGDLFRDRSLHMMERPVLVNAYEEAKIIQGLKEGNANQLGRNFSVFIESIEDAQEIRAEMLKLC